MRTVADVIKRLQELPQDAPVAVWNMKWYVLDSVDVETKDDKQAAVIMLLPLIGKL